MATHEIVRDAVGETSGESFGTESPENISDAIVGILSKYRRGVVPECTEDAPSQPEVDLPCARERQDRISRYVQRGEPVHFVIPAFPAKSPNRTKVLGALPDLGERIALEFLQSLCDYIGHAYDGGARITICSDGHVFGDVVGVSDDTATAYRDNIVQIVDMENWNSIDMYGLGDAFGGDMDYPELRDVLENEYATPLEQVRESVRTEKSMGSLFNGMHRFMYEDALGIEGQSKSKSALRREAKEAAYQTIRRSNAWSRVVAERFPDAVRLSIHPQPPESEKFGLSLMRARDSWLTPWHGVVLDDGQQFWLVKRWEAEEVEASLVLRDGRPSHFVAPHLSSTDRKVHTT